MTEVSKTKNRNKQTAANLVRVARHQGGVLDDQGELVAKSSGRAYVIKIALDVSYSLSVLSIVSFTYDNGSTYFNQSTQTQILQLQRVFHT